MLGKKRIICKLIRDVMLSKDPYCFQNYTICNCSCYCHIQQLYRNDDKKYFPKNYEEYVKIRSDYNFLKRNLPGEKDS